MRSDASLVLSAPNNLVSRSPGDAMNDFDPAMAVLVVDDYASMRGILCSLLNKLGLANVGNASNGLEALTKMRESKYSLVLSDWHMEPMSGVEFLSYIRAEAALTSTPVIMVTADAKADGEAMKAGASAFIVKPFNVEALREKIKEALAHVERHRINIIDV